MSYSEKRAESQTSALHRAALDLAAKGIAVFPCHPGTKVPATARGFHDASKDPTQIDTWWSEDPNYNPAFCPDLVGLGVVDIDGMDGEENWARIQAEHGAIPDTYEVTTPRGGRHQYFKGVLPPTQGRLADHIDTRGQGSYVLAPPSRVRLDDGSYGEYRVAQDRPEAELPEWITTEIGKARERAKAAAGVNLDQPQNIARARKLLEDYVTRGLVAVEGQMGDYRTYVTACEIINLGLSEDTALDLLVEVWNPACVPPWDETELATKVSNAAAYAQNEPGAWAVEPTQDIFAAALDKLAKDDAVSAPGSSRFRLILPSQMRALPEPTYVVDGLIPEQGLVLIYGAPASLKTFLVLDILASTAAGVPAFNRFPTRQGATVLCAGEAPFAVARRRWPAFLKARSILSPDSVPFAIVAAVPLVSDPDQVATLIAEMKAANHRPRIVAVDTVARAVGGMDENDARAAGLVIAAAESLRDAFGCAVLLIHHSGKDQARGARGSSALVAGVDAVFRVDRARDALAVTLHCEKMKDADEPADVHLRGEPVEGSLAFHVVSADEHAAATRANPPLSPGEVGGVLQRAGAMNGVEISTHALAISLDPDADEKTIKAVEKRLRRGADGALAAYVADAASGKGSSIKWTFPVLERVGK